MVSVSIDGKTTGYSQSEWDELFKNALKKHPELSLKMKRQQYLINRIEKLNNELKALRLEIKELVF
tara:strand:- start:302 stop:499 length:198 start_codon:yes stop_codon:yes gene_type:complete